MLVVLLGVTATLPISAISQLICLPGKKSGLFKAYAMVKLLVIDDLGLTPLTDGQINVDHLTRQPPIEYWHQHFGNPTLVDAVLEVKKVCNLVCSYLHPATHEFK